MDYNIQYLDNDTLLKKTHFLAREERKITLLILHHLREISKRRLFALRGFGSLFEYVTQELGYSDAAAARRLAAMRLLAEVPGVEEKIKSGVLNLSNAAQAQRLFQSEKRLKKPFSLDEKKEILATIENKTTREVERELVQRSSQPVQIQRPDQIKTVTATHTEIRFVADQVLLDQLEVIKGLLAHKMPHLSMAELLSEMAKLSLEKLQPKAPKFKSFKIKPTRSKHNHKNHSGAAATNVEATNVEVTATNVEVALATDESGAAVEVKNAKLDQTFQERQASQSDKVTKSSGSRYIPVEVKRAVYQRDEGRCCYIDPVTERKCNSSFAIEYEHRHPFAQGGQATVDNIEILCAVHNRVRAIHSYGVAKMSAYLRT